MPQPIEMQMEAANSYVDREIRDMLEDLEDEIRERDFAAFAEVRKVSSDRFMMMRED